MQALIKRFSALLRSAWPKADAPSLALPSLPGVAVSLLAVELAGRAESRVALVVVPDQGVLEQVYADTTLLASTARVAPLLFPLLIDGDSEADALRMQAATTLGQSSITAPKPPLVIITTCRALLQPMPTPAALVASSLELSVDQTRDLEDLVSRVVANGYERLPEVEVPGQLAVRGGILDVWSPDQTMPWRIEFFGDTIESIRSFDPQTQRSVDPLKKARVAPCSGTHLAMTTLPETLPEASNILWVEHDRIRGDLTLGDSTSKEWRSLVNSVARSQPALQCFSGDPPPSGMAALPLRIAPVPGLAELGASNALHPEMLAKTRKQLLARMEERTNTRQRTFLFVDTPGTCEVLLRELGDGTRIKLQCATLSGGFVMPGLTVASQTDIYGARRTGTRRAKRAVVRGNQFESIADLHPGDLVVHIDHGVGRFQGASEIIVNSKRSEVFTILYEDDAKLHVPVSHAHLLSRYVGVAGRKVKLHRLGGKRWTREKKTAEHAVSDLASSLLDTQAQRQLTSGLVFNTNPLWMREFEADFPYQETEDQTRVIAEIKRDMGVGKPMDRLVCGDAGYGKTEVAMRAAFIAVMNGYQVAVLVPTTVLAEQHYETFSERMAAYPVKIAVLSRFHSQGHRLAIAAEASEGLVDIVIGTHALLAPGIEFKNLGLLVIDEEQRFGVRHKERLKRTRQLVDVLALSATPIPRTLYMSMTGARDMSLLQTPPHERVAVETRVARDNDTVIANAIRRELLRGGQVFFLYNRVMTISRMRYRLERLVPEARIVVAHGQMADRELAGTMRIFESGQADVLLCTTIVESGLDIPRANTIIVHRADRFGIADLYQLRGRVGRSSHKGFAWLLTPEYGHIDEDARERIAALRKHSGLGAGFNLALRDLEIRGAGNLLGSEQSGHIAAVGFNLYCQLLRRTIARLRGQKPPMLVSVDLTLDFLELSPGNLDKGDLATLPYAFVEDEAHRLGIYRRIAEVASEREVRALEAEIADRYGKLPPAVKRLLALAELRIIAANQRLGRIETRSNKVFLYRQNERTPLLYDGRLPRLTGKDANAKLASLLKLLSSIRIFSMVD